MVEENYVSNSEAEAEKTEVPYNGEYSETPEAVAAPNAPPAEPEPEPEVAPEGGIHPGLQKLREAINLIKTHSAATIHGSMLHDALLKLEESFTLLYEEV